MTSLSTTRVRFKLEKSFCRKGGFFIAKKAPASKRIIFRRFRKLKNGRILDAWDYGLKAWPINLD